MLNVKELREFISNLPTKYDDLPVVFSDRTRPSVFLLNSVDLDWVNNNWEIISTFYVEEAPQQRVVCIYED